MSFVVGDKVFVKLRNKNGTILQQRERADHPGMTEWQVQFTQYHLVWLTEEQMEHIYEFNNEFEQSLRDLLIDINLLHNPNELHIVKDLYNQKFDLLKGI
ncbi:MAG: hypothetical protein ABTA16_18885 [Niallia sp.]